MSEQHLLRDDVDLNAPGAGHEPRDVNTKSILWIGAGLVGCAVGIHLGVWWLFHQMQKWPTEKHEPVSALAVQEASRPLGERLQDIPAPRLEGMEELHDQRHDVRPRDLKPSHQDKLNSYGWLNREKGIVHFPIDRAMRIIAEREARSTATDRGEKK